MLFIFGHTTGPMDLSEPRELLFEYLFEPREDLFFESMDLLAVGTLAMVLMEESENGAIFLIFFVLLFTSCDHIFFFLQRRAASFPFFSLQFNEHFHFCEMLTVKCSDF